MTGDEARELRMFKGLSQQKLAGLLGVAKNTVARRERGERPIGRETELAIRFVCGRYDAAARGIALAPAPSGFSAPPADAQSALVRRSSDENRDLCVEGDRPPRRARRPRLPGRGRARR